ncbi:MAG TPA: redoxin domain-containing protein [Sedimentisphaerales bacterium]|jgi:peroxiredoxin|nr:redoxin domain-containing protein [Sedimentisphaerales bacterium]HNU30363.1 redoxin domain-containing protein [Sedimentisphaerales bacterium]
MCRPILVSILAVVAISSATAVRAVASASAPEPIQTLRIGAAAPDFALPGVDGRTHKLSEYSRAKVLVVVFTCNHCPTAQAYEARIAKLAADYRNQGVVLVAISPNDPLAVRLDELGYTDVGDSFEDMKIRAKDRGFKFHYLYDGDKQEVSKAYGPIATPHVFVFDADRKLRYTGRVDDNERDPNAVKSPDARNAIEALLAGKPVPVETTKPPGCSIKWSDKRASVSLAFEKWAQEDVAWSTIRLEAVKTLLQNDTNKLRLINLWSIGCRPCVQEFPSLVEINRMYRGRDFEMVSINLDGLEGRGKTYQFLTDKEASFTNYVYVGDGRALLSAVDPKWTGAIPYTLVIKPGGEVLHTRLGMIDPLAMKKVIVDYLGRTYK